MQKLANNRFNYGVRKSYSIEVSFDHISAVLFMLSEVFQFQVWLHGQATKLDRGRQVRAQCA